MKRPSQPPIEYWTAFEPPTIETDGHSYDAPEPPARLAYWLLPERYLPSRAALAEGQPRAWPTLARLPDRLA